MASYQISIEKLSREDIGSREEKKRVEEGENVKSIIEEKITIKMKNGI